MQFFTLLTDACKQVSSGIAACTSVASWRVTAQDLPPPRDDVRAADAATSP